MAYADENDSVLGDNDVQGCELKDLMDGCENNGVVTLEGKTYCLDGGNDTRIVLDKTVTVEGVADKTVIDGNNTSLMLEVTEKTKKDDEGPEVISFWRDGYEFKYLGKNVTFKNIAFKDLKLVTWHEMTFENCRFVNSTFTSYEYENTFENCSFDKSTIEIVLFYGFDDIYKDHSRIIGCKLCESLITFKGVYTPYYIDIIGGDQFRIVNSMEIKDSMFSSSNISLYRYNVTIANSSFENSNIESHSSAYNITGTGFTNPKMGFAYSIISLSKSNLTDPKLHFSAGYFSNGCMVSMDEVILSNCEMNGSISYGSRKGSLKINNSIIDNSTLYTMYSEVLINNSIFAKSTIEFFFADAHMENSTFVNDANVTDTIKTRTYADEYSYNDDGNFTVKQVERQIKTNYTVQDTCLVNGSGKYEITSEDINIDTTYRVTVNQTGPYYFNDKLIIKIEDCRGNPVSGLEIFIEDLNSDEYPTPSAKTDRDGIAKFTLNKLGNLSLKIYYVAESVEYHYLDYGITVNLTVRPTISDFKIRKVNFAKNVYSQIKGRLEIKIIGNSSADLNSIKFAYKVYTNGKSKTYYSKTDSEGKTTFKLPESLTAGKHKIEIRIVNTNIKRTVTAKVAKAKTTVKAAKVANKFKKSQYFRVTVKNKATKKVISNVKVKIKVYTGKKYRTYTVKTSKKGIAKINTKNLKPGKHRVVISSGNANYQINAKSTIAIRK